MNCKEMILRVSDYVDGDLDEPLRREIEFHMLHCEDCRMIIDQIRVTVRIFAGSQEADMPAGVRDRLHQTLRQKFSGQQPAAS